MRIASLFAVTATLALGGVIVHADANEDAVKARQALMKTVGAQTKILGTQAKAGDAFDAAAAQEAATKLAEAAAQIPVVFETETTEGKTEARPVIWENYEDFTDHGKVLETAAMAATEVSSAAELGAAMGDIGGACKACHQDYRAKN